MDNEVKEVKEAKPPIILTERAITEIKQVMAEQNLPPHEYALDVGVQGGGCSGFQYKLGFKKKEDIKPLTETIYPLDGLDAVIGLRSMLYLEGVTIDFHEGLTKRGFVFNNPNATGKCGCGSSFSV